MNRKQDHKLIRIPMILIKWLSQEWRTQELFRMLIKGNGSTDSRVVGIMKRVLRKQPLTGDQAHRVHLEILWLASVKFINLEERTDVIYRNWEIKNHLNKLTLATMRNSLFQKGRGKQSLDHETHHQVHKVIKWFHIEIPYKSNWWSRLVDHKRS